MPNSGSVALREPAAWLRVTSSISAGDSGNLYISPFSNVAPGIAENFSWQYSQFAWIVFDRTEELHGAAPVPAALLLRVRLELLGRRVARQHVAKLAAYG